MLKNAYYKNMSERFVGKVVRTERDGFTVIDLTIPLVPAPTTMASLVVLPELQVFHSLSSYRALK